MTGLGEDKKDGDVPYLVKGYPRPAPPILKRRDIYDPEDFKDIDARVAETPDDKLCDFPTLVDHLTGRLATDVQKVRAMFSWLGHQNVIDTEYPDATDSYTPKAFLKSMKTNQVSYCKLFTLLCREARIPCVILDGQCRVGIGEEGTGFSNWNAVYLEGGWRFVHCYWAFVSVVGKNTGGWLKVEEDGQKMREEIQETEGTTKHAIGDKDGYFLTDPEAFIYRCRPKDDKWQLLKSPFSKKRFLALPYIALLFTESNFSFRSGQEGTINSINGECDVIIKAGKWNGQLKYILFYKQTPEKEFPDTEGADRYVAMLNKNAKGEFKFRVRFPIEGEYKLTLHRKKGQVFSKLCDFILLCKERKARCDPLPETPAIGWGPGVTAKQEGIYDTSHDEGIIESRKGKNLEVTFKLREKQKITPRLKHCRLTDNHCKQFLTMSIKNQNVSIKLRPDDGEYALLIDSYRKDRGVKNVLNYIIESGEENRRREGARENTRERNVRQLLKKAIRENMKDDLRKLIETFTKLKMDDMGTLTKARQALETLEIKKNLKDALMRARKDEIEKAIRRARASDVADRVQPDVEKAQACLDDLLHRQATPRALSAVNNRNVAEMRYFRTLTDTQKDIFSAIFLLLGENRQDLQDAKYVMTLLNKTGNEGLLRRLKQFDPERARPEVVTEVKRLLGRYQEDEIARICASVLKVFQAGRALVDNYNRTRSPSIRNEASPVASDVPDNNITDNTDQHLGNDED